MSDHTMVTIAKKARIKVLELIYKAQTSHIGSNFSAIDIMAVLFEKVDPKEDEIILSKGWAAAAWYYFLWRKGIISEEELNSFCGPCDKCLGTGFWEQYGRRNAVCFKCDGYGQSKFIGLVEPMNRWGLRIGGGSMGLGLPGAVGLALAKKLKKEEGKVYVLLSDGECQIGTFYESILLTKQHSLSNLVVLVDNNKFCAMGRTKDILDIEPLHTRIRTFGWYVQRINGHNFSDIESSLEFIDKNAPNLIICDTEKGFPISFMRSNNVFHYKSPSPDEYRDAMYESMFGISFQCNDCGCRWLQ